MLIRGQAVISYIDAASGGVTFVHGQPLLSRGGSGKYVRRGLRVIEISWGRK